MNSFYKDVVHKMVPRLPIVLVIMFWKTYIYASNEIKLSQTGRLFLIQNMCYTYLALYFWKASNIYLCNLTKLMNFYAQINAKNILSHYAVLSVIVIYVTTMPLIRNSLEMTTKSEICHKTYVEDNLLLAATFIMSFISSLLCFCHILTIICVLIMTILNNNKYIKKTNIIDRFKSIVPPNDHTCPICLQQNKDTKLDWIILDCKHMYHKECCSEWFKKKPNCPYCWMKYN